MLGLKKKTILLTIEDRAIVWSIAIAIAIVRQSQDDHKYT